MNTLVIMIILAVFLILALVITLLVRKEGGGVFEGLCAGSGGLFGC